MRIITAGGGTLPQGTLEVLCKEHKIKPLGAGGAARLCAMRTLPRIYDAAVFVSSKICGGHALCAEADELNAFRLACKRMGIEHIIYIAPHVQADGFDADIQSLIEAQLKKGGCAALYIPFIYDVKAPCYPLDECAALFAGGRAYFANGENDRLAFIAAQDLGVLLLRMLDAGARGVYYASGAYSCTVRGLCAEFKKIYGGADVRFGVESALRLPCIEPVSRCPAKASFGVFETHVLTDDIANLCVAYGARHGGKGTALRQRLSEFFKRMLKPSFLHVLGITALFVIMEGVTAFTQKRGELSFSDFRLLFACVGGEVYGLAGGGYAAALACGAYLLRRLLGGTSAAVMFYNPENWLPFVFYLAAGCGFGYTHDKHLAHISQLSAKLDGERKKYAFIESMYTDTSSEGVRLKQRLIGSRESLGRIYALVSELDKGTPEEVIAQLITTAGEMLENDSCAIYSVGSGSYARLMACAPALEATLAKSLDIKGYKDVFAALDADGIWKNTQLDKHLPMYCALICSRERKYLLFLYDAKFEQMNTYYENEIKVLCGLARQSFVRAAQYFEAAYAKCCIPGTQLFNAFYFKRRLSFCKRMQKEKQADFLLCRIYKSGLAYSYLSARISAMMRVHDIAGCLDDGNVYIIFAQMRPSDFGVVEKRFAECGIKLLRTEAGAA